MYVQKISGRWHSKPNTYKYDSPELFFDAWDLLCSAGKINGVDLII